MKKETKYLEMWKTNKWISFLDCLFDTCFLVFVWIMGWKIFFWIYLPIFVISTFSHVNKINKLEKKINDNKP